MNKDSGFHLSKWYVDCVAEDGKTFIGYSAHFRWKIFSHNFSSILIRNPQGDIHTETSLLGEALPHRDNSTIRWASKSLNIDGVWTSLSKPIERPLYKGDGGEITWSCLLPMAKVCVKIGKSPPVEGLGYVEHMTLSIRPWRLPITELRWGRFHTARDSLVWIDWKGTVPKTLVFHNAEEVSSPSITDIEIQGDQGLRLALARNASLRSGPIVSTTLSTIPGITKIFPKTILQMHECKWLSKGDLSLQGSASGSGWAIHELVKFG